LKYFSEANSKHSKILAKKREKKIRFVKDSFQKFLILNELESFFKN